MTDFRSRRSLERLVARARGGRSGDRPIPPSCSTAGVEKCAKKLGEEAVEAALAAVMGDREGLTEEAADVLYHLLVVLEGARHSARRGHGRAETRTAQSGLAEKAAVAGRSTRPMDMVSPPDRNSPYRDLHARGMGDAARRHAADADRRRSRRGCARSTIRIDWTRSRRSICRCRACSRSMSRRRRGCSAPRALPRHATARRCPTSSASPAASRSANHHGAHPAGAAAPLAEHAEGRSRHDRRLPAAERRARARRADGRARAFRKATTCRRCCASSPTSRPASAASRRRSTRISSTTSCRTSESIVDRPDILIVEGLNVLQAGAPPRDGKAMPFVSDFFDFSIYLDADEAVLARLVCRALPARCATPPSAIRRSYFHRYAVAAEEEARAHRRRHLGDASTCVNLRENILPTRPRAEPDPAQGRRATASRKWRCENCNRPLPAGGVWRAIFRCR